MDDRTERTPRSVRVLVADDEPAILETYRCVLASPTSVHDSLAALDNLAAAPWLYKKEIYYWGDIDTHGFAILNRARSHLPGLRSVLMDEATLLGHRDLWVEETVQHAAEALPLLGDAEQAVYQGLKRHTWGQNVRLEQERVAWDAAWRALTAGTNT